MVGAKGFWNQFGTGIATPFVATYKKINPQLAKSGNETNKGHTKRHTGNKTESLNKKLNKVESKFASKNSFSYLKPKTKKEMKHNQKFSTKTMNEKQTKFNKVIKEHTDKQNARNKKWDEQDAKKQKRKSHK